MTKPTRRVLGLGATWAIGVGICAVLLAVGATPAAAATFTNSASITIADATCLVGPGTATPYPSTITVSGLSGTITDVNVTLSSVTHTFKGDLEILLVGPGGQNLVLLGDAGVGPLVNGTVVLDDAAASAPPQNSNWAPGTYKPVDYVELDPDTYPAPAPAPSAATTLGTFNGTNANGTWSLYVLDDACGDVGSIGAGWSLDITTAANAATSTVVGSSVNPSRTGDPVTFTATVTASAVPVTTGTVTFTEGATTLASNVPLDGSGQATFMTTALTEGDHVITATYSGATGLATSGASVNQRVDNDTTVVGTSYCNTGAVTIPSIGASTPYPSNVFVTGSPTSITEVEVSLVGVTHTFAGDVDVLLVGPTGQSIVLVADAGTSPVSNVTLDIDDDAAGSLSSIGSWGSAGTTVPTKPIDHVEVLPVDAWPAPAPATSPASTLAAFDGTDPNGTWSLYVVDDGAPETGTIAGGWCVDITAVAPDTTPPTVTIDQAAGQADPTRGSPISFTVVFSEPVTGFATGDVFFAGSTVGGTLVGTVTGSGTTYDVAVTGMTGAGTVVASLPAGVATDAGANGNLSSTSTDNTVTYDAIAPTVTIDQAAGQADPTGGSTIDFTVVFSEAVTGFATGDVSFAGSTVGGTLVGAVTGSGTTYNVAVTGMAGDGTVVASVPAGGATDGVNGNDPSTSTDNTVTYDDATAPTVSIDQAAGQADPTSGSPIEFTVVFSEPVTGFATGDVSFAGSTVGGTLVGTVTGSGTTYDVAVTGMTGAGTVVASVPAGVATDAGANVNDASTSTDNTVTYDAVGPTVTIDQAAGQADPTNGSPISFTVVFSEPVTGFATGDVSFAGSTVGGTLVGIVTGSGTTYDVAVTGMTADGTVVASVPAGVATDGVANANGASTSTDNTVTYDTTAPTVTMTSPSPDPTGAAAVTVTVQFSEAVVGFVAGDIATTNATVSSFATIDADTYTFTLTATAAGPFGADIAGGGASDPASNASTAAASFTRTYQPPPPLPPPPPTADAACFDGTPSEGFVDVSADNVHLAAIDCIGHWGIALGVDDGHFAPAQLVTRGQLVSFVARLLDVTGDLPSSTPPDAFDDDDGSVHEDAIDRLAALGVMTGTADRGFHPDQVVTREQLASILVRAYSVIQGAALPDGPDAFSDDDGSVHEGAIDAAAAAGFVFGSGDGRYHPMDALRRDQMASVLARALDRAVVEGHAPPTPTG